jgi:cobalt-zinc-cadmium efflux system outer membrane protein
VRLNQRVVIQGVPAPIKSVIIAALTVVCAAALAGCVASSEHTKHAHFSGEIQRRTGHGIRSEASRTNQFPSGIELADGLQENETVALALWNNAAFQENLSKLGRARGDLAQAGLLSNPTFSILFPLGPKQLEFAATLPLEALWLRPRRMAIAKIDAERVAEGLVQNGLDLVRDVRGSLSDLELARDRLRLSRDAVVLRERIAKITEARQRAGEGNELDTLAAQAEVARARDDAERFARDVTVAQERLLFLLGWNSPAMQAEFAPNVAPPALTASVEELERRALAGRPDLRACELAVEAAGKRAGLARAEIFALSGIIDANGSGKEGFEIGPGAQLPIPIFNQNQAGRARAAAELDRAAWSCVGAQQRIRLEVREAHTKSQQAAEALQNWNSNLIPSLEELVRRSEKAYELGEMSPLAVQENARQLLAARVRQAELTADLRRAWAELERSVGTSLRASSKASHPAA